MIASLIDHDVSPTGSPDVSGPLRAGVIRSADLLADGKLVHIQHRGELYALRETRLGKLILTK